MKTKLFVLLCGIQFLVFFSLSSLAQTHPNVVSGAPNPPGPISGPTSVVMPATSSQYTVPAIAQGITLNWSISPTTAGAISASINVATVRWIASFSGAVRISCSATNSKGTSAPSTLSVNVIASPLTAATITPSSQKINYNIVPVALSGSPQGGSGTFTYQWQSSPGNMTFTNINGATAASYSPGALATTTSYQLIVTNNGTSVTSNIATVFVNSLFTQQFTHTADSLLLHLDKSAISTGILYDRAFPIASLNNVNVNEIDTTNHLYFLEAYCEIYSSAYNQSGWLPVDTIRNRAVAYAQQSSSINVPVGLSFYTYNIIDINAIANNLIQMHSDSLYYDTPNRTASPYDVLNTFVASPLLDSVNAQNALRFIFPSNLFINKSGLTLTSLMVDFGDGLGLVNISVGSSHSVNYSGPDGFRNLLFQATMSNGIVYKTYGKIKVYGTANANAAIMKQAVAAQTTCSASSYGTPFSSTGTFKGYDENTAIPGNGYLQIDYATSTCDGVLRKPVIISEYFSPGGLTNSALYNYFNKQSFTYNSMGFLDYLRSKGYDIVTVTYNGNASVSDGSTDYIERNAQVLITAIDMVNNLKQGTAKNILMGPSMGGLVTRYALAYMEQHSHQHQVGLWVSYDAPQEGANIPLGDQEFADKVQSLSPEAREALNQQANNPAAKEMLISHYLANQAAPAGAPGFRDRFNSVINQLGFPKGDSGQPFRKIAIADGSLGGNEVLSDGSVAFRFQAADIRTVNLFFFKVRINFFTAAAAQVNFEPAKATTAAIFTFNGVVWLPVTKFFTTPSYTSSIDAAPGGTFNTQQTIVGYGGVSVASFLFVNIKTYFTSVQNNHSFISTKSALAFQGSNQNLSENVSGRNLVCTGETPFDSYFAPLNTNNYHITAWSDALNWLVQEINGNPQAPATTLSNSTAYTINGPSSLCTGNGTYSINNLPQGAAVYWTATPASSATLTPNGQQVTVTPSGTSSITLNATVVTNCISNTATPISISLSPPATGSVTGPVSGYTNDPDDYSFVAPNIGGATAWHWSTNPTSTYFSGSGQIVTINFYNAGSYGIECDVTTPCGTVQNFGTFTAIDRHGGDVAYAVYPNPANTTMSVGPTTSSAVTTNSLIQAQSKLAKPFTYELFNKKGQVVRRGSSKDGSAVKFDTSGLPADFYYLHIINVNKTIEKQVIVAH